MTFSKPLAAGVFCALFAGTAATASPCTDQIAPLDARLSEVGRAAVSASSGGQGVAAAREAQAMEARDQGEKAGQPAVPFQAESQERQATQRATEAGGGGDRVMQARATLNRARTLDAQGNSAGCMEAVAEAKREIDALPP